MIRQILLGLGLPTLLAAVVVALAWRPWRRATPRPVGAWGPPLALAIAFAASFLAEAGWPGVPPGERWQWLLPVAAAAGLLGLLAGLLPDRGVVRLTTALAAGVMTALAVRLPGMDTATWRAGTGCVVVATILSLDRLADRRPGITLPVLVMVAFTAASVALVQARFAKIALMCGAMAAGGGVLLVLGLGRPPRSLARGGAVTIGTLLPLVLLCGHAYDYGDVPAAAFILPALIPFALWLGEAPLVARRTSRVAATARLAIIVLLGAVAMGLAVAPSSSAPAEEESWDSLYGG